MTNGKSRLGTEHLMTPILLRDNALIMRQGQVETGTPIRAQHMLMRNHSDRVLEYRWLM